MPSQRPQSQRILTSLVSDSVTHMMKKTVRYNSLSRYLPFQIHIKLQIVSRLDLSYPQREFFFRTLLLSYSGTTCALPITDGVEDVSRPIFSGRRNDDRQQHHYHHLWNKKMLDIPNVVDDARWNWDVLALKTSIIRTHIFLFLVSSSDRRRSEA